MIIYKTINLINGKIYIGQSKWNNSKYFGSGNQIIKAIKKYGIENFKKEIICECKTHKELDKMERYWIKKLNSQDRNIGYNLEDGGNNGSWGPIPDYIKEKISKSMKNRPRPKFSNEWCENISKGKLGQEPWNKGKSWNNPRMWINNGKEDKFILIEKREKYLNWKNGRFYRPNPNKAIVKNRIWICKNDQTKMINKLELNDYIKRGWVRGRKWGKMKKGKE